MFVKGIEYGITANAQSVNEPSWSFVEQQLRFLDGELIDGVILRSAGGSYMGICGGMCNEYVVAGHLDGYGSFICASGRNDSARKQVSVNGDFNEYPSRNVVNLDTAISAAKDFYECGILSEEMNWELQ